MVFPLARDAVTMYLYRSVSNEDHEGDVVEGWKKGCKVLVTAYPVSSSRLQDVDGLDVSDAFALTFVLPFGKGVRVGDRLGTATAHVYDLVDVQVLNGTARCTGVKL